MEEEWKRKVAGPYKRDYDGYQGAIRLWLPAYEYEENSKTQFIQGSSVEKSKQKKNPQDWETDAFRAHALEAGLDHSNSFFGGLSTMNMDKEDAMEPGPEEAAEVQVKQVSPTKKRKAETLDASEDEAEARGSSGNKKPRKNGNLSAARAAFSEMASKQYVAKLASLQARLDEAKKAVDAEATSVTPANPTDVTTRKLYKDALDAVLEVATSWMDPSTLVSKVAAHNAKDEVKASEDQQVDTKQAESLSQQLPSLTWLLTQSKGAALRMERTDFLRTKEFMQKFVDDIPAGALEEARLDKQRVVWRRMFGCLTQLESSVKKCSGDLTKHVKALAAAQERAVKKQKDKEAKEAAAEHLSNVQAKITKAKADGSDMPGIFKLKDEELKKVRVVKGNMLPSDFDATKPFVLGESCHVSAWANNPTCLQILTNFGSRYKKTPTIEECGKVNQPLQPKAGNEQTETLFGEAHLHWTSSEWCSFVACPGLWGG